MKSKNPSRQGGVFHRHNTTLMTLTDRLYPTLCALGVALLIWYGSLLIGPDLWDSDFRVFYTSAVLLRTDPQNLYDPIAQATLQRALFYSPSAKDELILSFINPPTALLTYLPVSYFPPRVAFFLYSGLSLIIESIAIYVLVRVFANHWSPKQKILFILFSLSFTPTYINLISGQHSSSTLLLFTFALLSLSKLAWTRAGILLGLLTYKPQLILSTLFFLRHFKKMGRGIILGLIASLGLIALLISRYQMEFFATFLDYAASTSLEHGKVAQLSWQGFVHQLNLFFPLSPWWATLLLSAVTLIGGTVLANNKRNSVFQTAAFSIPLLLLGAIHIHTHDALLLLIPIAYLWDSKSVQVRILLCWTWVCFFFAYFSPFYPYPFVFFPQLTLILLTLACIRKKDTL